MRSNIDRASFQRITEMFVRDMTNADEIDVPRNLTEEDVRSLVGELEFRLMRAFQPLNEIAKDQIQLALSRGEGTEFILIFRNVRDITGDALGDIKRTVEAEYPSVAKEFLGKPGVEPLYAQMIGALVKHCEEMNSRRKS